ncbi:MAG: hypothetical protein JWL96_3153 [Sphingomonas bacterium]|uniref:DUF4349 domain-containing protein n=1 Tax=Sphingomonas bacterium TaxID=1895847 RepID=UPI002629A1E3|nr:DUF4349 domain-containing protein [Sphingomonas bacterium]MDB5711083.1 hypothetical protein [Sphingomonas bacterium]
MRKRVKIASIALAGVATAAVVLSLGISNRTHTMAVQEKLNTYDVAPPPSPSVTAMNVPSPAVMVPPQSGDAGDDADAAQAAADPIAVAVPRVAYKYAYAFSLPGTAIPAAQHAHVALCDKLGPARCQVLGMESKSGDNESASGSLKLRVDSGIARRFGDDLQGAIGHVGGHADSRSIEAEDVSKETVDTAARLKQRELLVARLTEVLRTHNGKVGELVEAERSVAAAQEEIDQARGWLSELQARVAMSTIDVNYAAIAPQPVPVSDTIGDSVSRSAASVVTAFGGLLRMAIYLTPWAVFAALAWFILRRFIPRWPSLAAQEEPDATPA